MRKLHLQDIQHCQEAMARGIPLEIALASLGGLNLGHGVWRIFPETSSDHVGAKQWNLLATWKAAWGLQENSFYAFGEDLFGNQLVFRTPGAPAMIWNHESGELIDLSLPAVELLITCHENGLEWIDFYDPKALIIGQIKEPVVGFEMHLHWIQPLILGGSVVIENTAVVDRCQHLQGHAALWRQLRGFDPGTHVLVKT